MRITSLIVSFFLLAVVPAHGIAQDTTGQAIETIPQTSPAQQTPPASDIPPHTNLVDRFLKDQGHIWTSPLHIKRGDVKWLLPLGAGAAALLATDQKLSDDVRSNNSLRSPSKFLSNFGGLNHFPSDVLIGAAVGELIGRYVLHRHKDELR